LNEALPSVSLRRRLPEGLRGFFTPPKTRLLRPDFLASFFSLSAPGPSKFSISPIHAGLLARTPTPYSGFQLQHQFFSDGRRWHSGFTRVRPFPVISFNFFFLPGENPPSPPSCHISGLHPTSFFFHFSWCPFLHPHNFSHRPRPLSRRPP